MMNFLHLGSYDARLFGDGSLRPLITELILNQLMEPFQDETRYEFTRRGCGWDNFIQASTATDELWRQAQAALSVGPLEYARFEKERAWAIVKWPEYLGAALTELLKKTNNEQVRIVISHPRERDRIELADLTHRGILVIWGEESK
jgi:hypothetical protein